MMPKQVTAVITSFNRVNFLETAVKSVLNQSLKEFELLILDNSSTDGTSEYLRTINDPRVKTIVHEAMGISEQRNLGVKLANSDFIGFLDDDDVWMPEKLELQVKALESNVEAGLVYAGFRFYSDEGTFWGDHLPSLKEDHFEGLLFTKDPFCGSASNPLMRKSSIISVGGYDNSVKVGEDWEMYIRLSQKFPIVDIPKILISIRQHGGPRLGDRVDDALLTDKIVLEKHKSKMSKNLQALYYQKMAFKNIRLGARSEARGQIYKSIMLKKINLKSYLLFLLANLPISLLNRLNVLRRHIKQRNLS